MHCWPWCYEQEGNNPRKRRRIKRYTQQSTRRHADERQDPEAEEDEARESVGSRWRGGPLVEPHVEMRPKGQGESTEEELEGSDEDGRGDPTISQRRRK